jgi:hypothetical protein
MRAAIDEMDRRRTIQQAYNLERGIEPSTIVKGIRDLNDQLRSVAEGTVVYTSEREARDARLLELDTKKVEQLVAKMEAEMRAAAKELEFERAAALRDEIQQIRLRVLDQDQSAIIARAAELAAQRTPARSGRAGTRSRQPVGAGVGSASGAGSADDAGGGANRDPDAPSAVFEVTEVTVLPAGVDPVEEAGPAEGTAADWLPGIRDEHEEEGGWQARLLDRPTWDRTVTPNIRRRQGTRPPRRRR